MSSAQTDGRKVVFSHLPSQTYLLQEDTLSPCFISDNMVIDTYTIVLHFRVVFSRQMIVVTVQLISQVLLFVTSWTAASQASLSLSILQSLFKLMSIESVMPSNHLILCRPLLLLPSIFPIIRVFSSEWWPKYWRFSFSISPSNEYSGLNSLKIDWFDLTKIDDKS